MTQDDSEQRNRRQSMPTQRSMSNTLLSVSSSQRQQSHTIGSRLSVPLNNPCRNIKDATHTRPRSASLRSVGSGITLWNEDKKCIICPIKEAIRRQSSTNKRSTTFDSDENEHSSSNTLRPRVINAPSYRSYGQRWIVLGTVCLLALSNATQWIAFAPLHEAANLFYCIEKDKNGNNGTLLILRPAAEFDELDNGCDVETWSSQIFQLVGVLTGLFGMFITDRYGIRVSCHFGSALNLCGAIVRVISSLPQIDKIARLPILYFGQTIAAMSQPFFLCLSPKVAEYWFVEDQRALANSLSFIANPFGVFLGSIAPIIFVSSSTSTQEEESRDELNFQIFYLNLSLLGLASFVMFFCLFVTRSKPPTLPSASSQCEYKPSFWEGLCILFRSPVFYIQTLTFGLAFAIQWSIFVTADKQLIGLGYGESKVTAYLLSLSAFTGTLSSVLAGWIVDRTKKFNEFIKISYVGIALAALALDVFLHFRHHQSDWDTAILVMLFALLGFFTIPIFPISLELGVESTFPVAEATSSGILIIFGQFQLFLLTFGMQSMESLDWIYSEEGNYKLSIDFWAFCAVFAAIFTCLFLWPKYYRLEYEQNAVFLNLLPPRFDEIQNGKVMSKPTRNENGASRQSVINSETIS